MEFSSYATLELYKQVIELSHDDNKIWMIEKTSGVSHTCMMRALKSLENFNDLSWNQISNIANCVYEFLYLHEKEYNNELV